MAPNQKNRIQRYDAGNNTQHNSDTAMTLAKSFRLKSKVFGAVKRATKVTKDAFLLYCKEKGGVSDAAHLYTAVSSRQCFDAVHEQVIAEFLTSFGIPRDGDSYFEPLMRDTDLRGRGWFNMSTVRSALLKPFKAKSNSAIDLGKADQELETLAKQIIETTGENNRIKHPDLTPLQIGELVMNRTVEQYASWLKIVYAASRNSVRYATVSGKRISVVVCFGVTEEAFHDLCLGRRGELDLTREDMRSASPYCFVSVVMCINPGGVKSKVRRQLAEIDCVYYQTAYFLRGSDPTQYSIVSFAVDEIVLERFERHGFVQTGKTLKDLPSVRMVVLQPPAEAVKMGVPRNADKKLSLFRNIIAPFKEANRTAWAQEV